MHMLEFALAIWEKYMYVKAGIFLSHLGEICMCWSLFDFDSHMVGWDMHQPVNDDMCSLFVFDGDVVDWDIHQPFYDDMCTWDLSA